MSQPREAVQPIRRLYQGLDALASPERYLFTPSDMRALVPDISAVLMAPVYQWGQCHWFQHGHRYAQPILQATWPDPR